MSDAKSYTFTARIEAGSRGGAYVEFPYAVETEFGTRGQVKILAIFDGVEYRGSLAPMGGGAHILGLTKAIRDTIGQDVGDAVEVTVRQDTEPRQVSIPADLREALAAHPALAKRFDALSYTRRKEMVRSLETAKKPDTRQRRLEKIVSELLLTNK